MENVWATHSSSNSKEVSKSQQAVLGKRVGGDGREYRKCSLGSGFHSEWY